MKVSAGEEHLAELALVQVVDKFLVAYAQAHAVGFVGQGSLGDHAISRTLHEIRHDARRNVAAELLAADHPGPLGNLLQTDVLGAHLGEHASGGHAASEVVAEKSTGYEGDYHHHADDKKKAAQDDFLHWARGLQKSKHACTKLQD